MFLLLIYIELLVTLKMDLEYLEGFDQAKTYISNLNTNYKNN